MLEALKATRIVIAGYLGILALIFARLMNFDVRKDEQLYLPPARLLADQNLYADFFYNHPPVSAWYFYGFMQAIKSDYLLLSGRLAIFFAWAIVGAALIGITYRLTRSAAASAFVLVSIMANTSLLNQTGMAATNNLLVLVVGYIGIGLYVVGITAHSIGQIAIFCSGIALSLAAGIKANAVVFIPVIAVSTLFLPNWAPFKERLLKVTLPLAIGGIIGALPVLLSLLQNPDLFLAHVVGFHTGPHVAYWAAQIASTDDVVAMTATAKLTLAATTWFGGANLILILMLAILATMLALSDSVRQMLGLVLGGEPGILVVCVAATVAISFVPTPGFPQYYTLPLACAPLLVSVLFAKLKPEDQDALLAPLIAGTAIILLMGLPPLLQHVPRLVQPAKWTVVRAHESGRAIANAIQKVKANGKVATLAPIYAIEGGLPVYPEFATGQFAYRTAEYNGAALKPFFRTTSAKEVGALLKSDPPAAILVGFETVLEAPLVLFAEQNNYIKDENLAIVDRYGIGILYVRPTAP